MSESDIVRGLAQLPPAVQDKFLDQLSGALMAVEVWQQEQQQKKQ